MQTALVFFGNQLPVEQFADDSVRDKFLERGISRLRNLPSLAVTKVLQALCAVEVLGPRDVVLQLRDDLESEGGGAVAIEDNAPAFEASPVLVPHASPAPTAAGSRFNSRAW